MYLNKLISGFLAFFLLNSLVIPAVEATEVKNKESACPPTEQRSRQITEEEVQEIVDNIAQAVTDRNIDGIVKYFAPFIYSEITVKNNYVAETVILNGVEENRLYLEKQAATIAKIEELEKYVQVRFSSDGQTAFINRTRLVNVFYNDGKKVIVASEGEARLAVVEGKVQIISIKDTARIALRPIIK